MTKLSKNKNINFFKDKMNWFSVLGLVGLTVAANVEVILDARYQGANHSFFYQGLISVITFLLKKLVVFME